MRKIPKNYRFITGQVGVKPGVAVEFEGPLERDFYSLMGLQTSVEKIESQPVSINYKSDTGRNALYTPDCLIHFTKQTGVRPVLAEIKDRATLRADWQKFRARFRAATGYARRNGWTFKIYTDAELRTPYLTNSKNLRLHRSHHFSSDQMMEIVTKVETGKAVQLGALLRDLTEGDLTLAGPHLSRIYHLLATRAINANLFQPITYSTELVPAGRWMESPWDKRWLRTAKPLPQKVRKGW